ncbi:MAG: SlyX family protein [Succinivibrionaceae bacterium]|nr:SlyX family protein [Succinivibrionaceae bacterium]
MDQKLKELLEQLETKISYLEYNSDALNDEVTALRDTVAKQQIQIKFLAEKLRAAEASNVASRSEETPPPHY